MESTANKNTATLMQLSALGQYFFPLGSFIFPTIIWSLKKNQSAFIDKNGKNILNFQLSLLLYSVILTTVSAVIILYNVLNTISFTMVNDCNWVIEQFTAGKITGFIIIGLTALFLLIVLKVSEFFLIIYAAVKNSHGLDYKFPLTIKFIK